MTHLKLQNLQIGDYPPAHHLTVNLLLSISVYGHGLSNGAIFSNLEQPLTQFSRSRHSFTLNISPAAKDTAIVATKCDYRKPYLSFRLVPFTMALNNGTTPNLSGKLQLAAICIRASF